MKTRLLVISLILCSTRLFSQTAKPEPAEPPVLKIVRVQGNARLIARLAMAAWGGQFEVSDALHVIVLRGKPSDVANVERTIQQLDALEATAAAGSTRKNVELTTYVIGGSMEPIAGAPEADGEILAPVIKQLRAIFPYNHYQLLSTMLMRSAQNAKARTEGIMKTPQNIPDYSHPSAYHIAYDDASVSAESSPLIHLTQFFFEAKIPYVTGSLRGKDGSYASSTWQQMTVSVQTDVDLREGQKVVVGKANVADSDSCFFIVLTARLVP